jgi:hypothetical protein
MRSFVCIVNRIAPPAGAFLLVATLLAACGREDVKVYRVAKGESPAPSAATMHDGHSHTDAATPQLSWTLPAGWQQLEAGQMNLATFSIAGAEGKQAQVAVTPLQGLAGKEVLIVNMWRQQVGLSELPEADATKELTDVEIGGDTGKMFDMAGKSPAGAASRIVTAMLHRGDTSWFFKLQGDDELVTAQKPNFIAFLKSVKFGEVAAPATLPDGHPPIAGNGPATGVPPTASPSGLPNWPAPAEWKAVAPGAMQVAKFSVPEASGAKADVTISVFPSSTGGTLANVNRWRRQIGLPPVDESGLAPLVKPLDEKTPDALIAELSNEGRRLVGAIVPAGGQWYFYKLMGDDAVVAQQKAAFTQFVKEVKY